MDFDRRDPVKKFYFPVFLCRSNVYQISRETITVDSPLICRLPIKQVTIQEGSFWLVYEVQGPSRLEVVLVPLEVVLLPLEVVLVPLEIVLVPGTFLFL